MSLQYFFVFTTLVLAIGFGCLIAYTILYDFSTLETGIYILGASIVLSCFGVIPLIYFWFPNEELYNWQNIVKVSGFYFGFISFLQMAFRRNEELVEETDENEEVLDYLEESNYEWKGRW